MINATSVTVRTVAQRIRLSHVAALISVLIIAAAGFTLFRLLRGIDIDKVVTGIRATPVETIALAAMFVAAGYVTLTFYDFFSLRTIGRREVPYRIAAFASFTSYSIGHNLGATVFTGGAIRFRIYSAWGLGLIDIAKIAFVTGLTFWLGNVFMLGLGLAYAPEAVSAVNQLPAWLNRAIGLGGLAAITGYLLWLAPRPRVVGRNNWQVTLPSAPLTLVQIGIGILDLGAGAIAIYILLPAHPAVDFATVLVTFVAATLLGFISHAPGSLGVFDAAMLVALPQFETEQLLVSLLLFRLLYFVIPFFLAAFSLGLRELWLATRPAAAVQDGGADS